MRPPRAQDPGWVYPRAQAIPTPHGVDLRLDGIDRLSYRFAPDGPRPFFFPLIGHSGQALTRLGHPGDPVGHSHHLSIWFAHEKVDGVNFWADRPGTDVQIRHRRVVCYQDGTAFSAFAAEIDWWAEGRNRLKQSLIVAIVPLEADFAIDLQSRFESPAGIPVELGQTNFGFLGVRVAKSMTEQFGGGLLTSSEGVIGEDAIFGAANRWVDYSGPSAPGVAEGIAYLDHPSNPHHPTLWHVRRDGWMCASFNQRSPHGVAPGHPLDLRYRLVVHPGAANPRAIDAQFDRFRDTRAYALETGIRGSFPSITRET